MYSMWKKFLKKILKTLMGSNRKTATDDFTITCSNPHIKIYKKTKEENIAERNQISLKYPSCLFAMLTVRNFILST